MILCGLIDSSVLFLVMLVSIFFVFLRKMVNNLVLIFLWLEFVSWRVLIEGSGVVVVCCLRLESVVLIVVLVMLLEVSVLSVVFVVLFSLWLVIRLVFCWIDCRFCLSLFCRWLFFGVFLRVLISVCVLCVCWVNWDLIDFVGSGFILVLFFLLLVFLFFMCWIKVLKLFLLCCRVLIKKLSNESWFVIFLKLLVFGW